MFQVSVKRPWLSAQRLPLLEELLDCHSRTLDMVQRSRRSIVSSTIVTLAVGIYC